MKSEWKRPDTIDDVEKFSELTDAELKGLVTLASKNEVAYADLKRLAVIEQRVRVDKIIIYNCVSCGRRTNGYPGSPRVKARKCKSCHAEEREE